MQMYIQLYTLRNSKSLSPENVYTFKYFHSYAYAFIIPPTQYIIHIRIHTQKTQNFIHGHLIYINMYIFKLYLFLLQQQFYSKCYTICVNYTRKSLSRKTFHKKSKKKSFKTYMQKPRKRKPFFSPSFINSGNVK